MNLRSLMRTATAAALISAASTAALAQDETRRVVKAGADGRFELQIDGTIRLDGHSAAKVAAFRTRLDAIVAQLQAMPAVNTPPYPVCSRLNTWLSRNGWRQRNGQAPVLAADVDVSTPRVVTPGKCDLVTNSSVEMSLNSLEDHLPMEHAKAPDGTPWFVLQASRRAPGLIEWEWNRDRYAYLFEPRGTPFKPVTTERYAQSMLDMLTDGGRFDGGEPGAMQRARMASWTPAERQLPACVKTGTSGSLEDIMVDPVADCPLNRTVIEVDDAWFDRTRPDVIQLIALELSHQHTMESGQERAFRVAIWETMDREALRAQIGR